MTDEVKFRIIESLYPDFREYADNERFYYWMDYACELDEILNLVYIDDTKLIDYLNTRIRSKRAGSSEHDACVDISATLEETIPEQYKGVFKYD